MCLYVFCACLSSLFDVVMRSSIVTFTLGMLIRYAQAYICIYIYATVPLACLASGVNCWCWNVYRNPFTAVAEFLPDRHPPAVNPSGIPAEFLRESCRFTKELAESQFFQPSRYPGILKMKPLSSNTHCFDPKFQ